jgi:hypothetical protein
MRKPLFHQAASSAFNNQKNSTGDKGFAGFFDEAHSIASPRSCLTRSIFARILFA